MKQKRFLEREFAEIIKAELTKSKYVILDKNNKKQYPDSNPTQFEVYLNRCVPKECLDQNCVLLLQPEIDMILVDKLHDKWIAIELKAIKQITDREGRERIMPSYYLGLGQTLAYLSFGFDEVALWQCFDASSIKDYSKIFRYNDAFEEIRSPMRDIVGRTCLKIATDGENKIQHLTIIDNKPKWEDNIGKKISEGLYSMRCVSPNPLLDDTNKMFSQKAKASRKIFEKQKTKWDKSNSD